MFQPWFPQAINLKKKLDRASIVLKMTPNNFSVTHLTRTQRAAGPNEESMRSEITPRGLSNASLRILELLGVMYSTYLSLLIYGLYSSDQ